jgi:hypothetical protein
MLQLLKIWVVSCVLALLIILCIVLSIVVLIVLSVVVLIILFCFGVYFLCRLLCWLLCSVKVFHFALIQDLFVTIGHLSWQMLLHILCHFISINLCLFVMHVPYCIVLKEGILCIISGVSSCCMYNSLHKIVTDYFLFSFFVCFTSCFLLHY